MERTSTQRVLRNDNAEIVRALEGGDTFIITRNGVPVGRLTPIRRRTFVPVDELLASAKHLGHIDGAASDPTWTHGSIKIRRRVPKHQRAFLDTSVVIDVELMEPGVDVT